MWEILGISEWSSLAQSVEHAAVNRSVVGSSPTGGVFYTWLHGQAVKTPPFHGGNRGSNPLGVIKNNNCDFWMTWLRHLVYNTSYSYMPMWLNWQSSWFVISRLSVRVRSSAFTIQVIEEWSRSILYCFVINGQIPEWPKGTDCKSAATCFGGSNPPPPIKINIDFLIFIVYNKKALSRGGAVWKLVGLITRRS